MPSLPERPPLVSGIPPVIPPNTSGLHRRRPDPVASFHEALAKAEHPTTRLRAVAERPTVRGLDLERPSTPATMTPRAPTIAVTPTSVPRALSGLERLDRLPLDPKAAFLLTYVDGATNVATLADVTGMLEDDVIAIIARLAELRVVILR